MARHLAMKELCEMLDIQRSTARRWMINGTIPCECFMKLGRDWRFDKTKVEKWLQQQHDQSQQQAKEKKKSDSLRPRTSKKI